MPALPALALLAHGRRRLGAQAPPSEPQSLGRVGKWDLGITSRACSYDFVILVQSAIPANANANVQGLRLMLSKP